MGLWRNVMSLLSIHINPTSNTICLCAVLAGLGTCTGVLWELVYAREKIHGPVICLLVLTKVEKVTLQVILGARLLPSAGFSSSTLGPGPGNPCCQQLRWWPLKAARLWCQPSGPQSNCPSAGPSCCAGSPSGTRGLPGYTGGLQDHVATQHVGGALWESGDQFLISTSYQLLADLGLCLVQDTYGICVPVKVAGDHIVGSGLASSLCCGCCGVVAMPLLLSLALWWWGWHCCCCCCGPSLALLLTARAVLVDFCCTGCCCHGECMLVNKGGPFVVFAATDLPTSSGPGGGPVCKCLRKVFIKK